MAWYFWFENYLPIVIGVVVTISILILIYDIVTDYYFGFDSFNE